MSRDPFESDYARYNRRRGWVDLAGFAVILITVIVLIAVH